jgi:hypothetical protein
MTDDLKQIAGKISEAYLLKKQDMNDAIQSVASEKKLNQEIIKRICEFANQNTYLSIFHSDKLKRGNINFDLADANRIIAKIKENNMAEKDYLTSPDDYRVHDEYGQEMKGEEPVAIPEEKAVDHLKELRNKLRIKDRLAILLSAIQSMSTQEEKDAEKNILKISSYCRGLVFNGESFGDMTKLALRYTKDRGMEVEKTSKLYQTIGDYLSQKGFNVNMELTKVSSLKINQKSDVFSPLEAYHLNLMKLSALREMEENINGRLRPKSA